MKNDTLYDVYRSYPMTTGEDVIEHEMTVPTEKQAIECCKDTDFCYAVKKLDGPLIFPHETPIEKEENILAFYSSENSKGKKDATGVFMPEAEAFIEVNGTDEKSGSFPINCIGTTAKSRSVLAQEVIKEHKEEYGLITTLTFFCHGWGSGNQFGFRKNNLKDLAQVIKANCTDDVKIALYSCSNADGPAVNVWPFNVGHGADGGFADLLRDHLARVCMARVDAHKTKGHATWNPYVVRFTCASVEDKAKGGKGGYWLVDPKSEHWGQWRRRLANQSDTLRYRFPLMTQVDILSELSR